MTDQSCNESPEDMVNFLLAKDEVFAKYFTESFTPQNVTKDEEIKAKAVFRESFPNYHIKDFLIFYNTYLTDKISEEMGLNNVVTDTNEICPKLAYDGTKRSYIRMPRVSNYGKRKREKFNLGEFLRTKRENGDYFQLSIGDREMVEDLLEELSEDKPRNDQKADVALNRMVEMAAILNGNCNYKLIELHSERRVQ